jgi:hypothetical protein
MYIIFVSLLSHKIMTVSCLKDYGQNAITYPANILPGVDRFVRRTLVSHIIKL